MENEHLYKDITRDIKRFWFENIKERREFIKTTCIISGALASFTLLTLGSKYISTKEFLIFAIILFLLVIGIGICSLKIILEKENKELAEIQGVLDEKRIPVSFVSPVKLDYTLDFQIYPLLGALLSIILAFLPVNKPLLWLIISVGLFSLPIVLLILRYLLLKPEKKK